MEVRMMEIVEIVDGMWGWVVLSGGGSGIGSWSGSGSWIDGDVVYVEDARRDVDDAS
jgi:hypothetical protein